MTRSRSAFVLLLLLSPLAAQQPFDGFDADIRAAGPPPWMNEGTRLTYKTSSASLDERGTGITNAAQGITHIDIAALARGTASGNIGNWANTPAPAFGGQGGWVALGNTGFSTPAGYGEFWVHPAVLKKVAEARAKDAFWKVVRGPYQSGGRSVAAISFTSGGDPDAVQVRYVYDEQSGIALFISTSRRAKGGGALLPLGISELVTVRDLALPWCRGRPPSWLAKFRAFVFSGRIVTAIPGGFPMQTEARFTFTVNDRGPNHLTGQLTQEVQGSMAPQGVTVVYGPSQVGGLWVPPLALAAIAKGWQGNEIEVDRDPATGARVLIVGAGTGQHGRSVVTVQVTTGAYSAWYDYEIATGMLVMFTVETAPLHMSVQGWFTGRE